MKILLSVDMEGITGVTTWNHVTPGHAEYARFRKIMTDDVNAAVRGAFAGGAEEVWVSDAHEAGSNILVEALDPRVQLNSGTPTPFSMMQAIDKGIDGVQFIGYHARFGSTPAVLDHTWSSMCVAGLWLNDRLAGEYTLNGALAGHFGAPVLMASGDQTACAQMVDHLGNIETAVVKQATGRYAALCLPPEKTLPLIEQKARAGVQRLAQKTAPAPLVLKTPIQVRVRVASSDMADRAMHMPGVTRSELELSFTARSMPEAYAGFRSLVTLCYPR